MPNLILTISTEYYVYDSYPLVKLYDNNITGGATSCQLDGR